MPNTPDPVNAEVIAVYPNKVRISVDNLASFRHAEESLRVGSYLKVSDNENVALMCIIESFSIEVREDKDGNAQRIYIIDAFPLGTLKAGKFRRGGDELAIPPKKVVPATAKEVSSIFGDAFKKSTGSRSLYSHDIETSTCPFTVTSFSTSTLQLLAQPDLESHILLPRYYSQRFQLKQPTIQD